MTRSASTTRGAAGERVVQSARRVLIHPAGSRKPSLERLVTLARVFATRRSYAVVRRTRNWKGSHVALFSVRVPRTPRLVRRRSVPSSAERRRLHPQRLEEEHVHEELHVREQTVAAEAA